MQNYRKLKFPLEPLLDGVKEKFIRDATVTKYCNLYYDKFEKILIPEVIDIFKKINITPYFFVVFCTKNIVQASRSQKYAVIHSDIRYNNIKKKWENVPFGLNWEITSGISKFQWWDMNAFEKKYPENLENPLSLEFNGIHYGHRMNLGKPINLTPIEECLITGPLLVNTQIPHSVIYQTDLQTRIGFSIRFSIQDISSFEDALEIFERYIENE